LASKYWFVRVVRNVPLAKLVPAVVLLPVLPPTEMSITAWWRRVLSGMFLRRRDLFWARKAG